MCPACWKSGCLLVWMPPWEGVPDMSHWMEASGQTQDMLERLLLSDYLRTGPPGGVGRSGQGEGSLGFFA